MKTQSITVVIPAFNSTQSLEKAVYSVINQSARPSEIIIVDDGSTDDTFAVANQIAANYPGFVRAATQANRGSAAARQAGSDMATSDFIAYLDADDWWPQDKLERLQSILSTELVHFLFTDLNRIDAAKPDVVLPGNAHFFPWAKPFLLSHTWPTIHDGLLPLDPDSAMELLLKGFPAFPSTYVVRRKALELIGGWREQFRRCQDFDVALRLVRAFGCHYLDESTAFMGINSVNHDTEAYFLKQTKGDVAVLKYQAQEARGTNPQLNKAVAERLCLLGYALRQAGDKDESRAAYKEALKWPGKRIHAVIRLMLQMV